MQLFPVLEQRYSHEHQSAGETQRLAQEIAFAPIMFQVSHLMVKFGILDLLNAHPDGLTQAEIAEKVKISNYAAQVLLEASPSIGTVLARDNRYLISKVGRFALKDKMARVNMDFMQEIYYQGMFDLEKALQTGKPEGLKVFGDWPIIYEGLSSLPSITQEKWFTFDHYYSDNSFAEALSTVFARPVKKLLDVSGSTGRWAEQCISHSAGVGVAIMNLPQQIGLMRETTEDKNGADRIYAHPANLLDPEIPSPIGFDVIWMSQFLDCFTEEQTTSILQRAATSMGENTSFYIMEPFWDRQRYETAAYCLTMTSLYLTTMASGNSKIFHSEDLTRCVEKTGLKVAEVSDGTGRGHSILRCVKAV